MNLKEAKQKKRAGRCEDCMPDSKAPDSASPDNASDEKSNNGGTIKMEEKIRNGIEQIRPFLQRDGGDIEFVEYTDDNIVKVRLLGHCQGCPHRQATINGMVAQVLQESYPEVAGVVAVD